jgi:serine/threonine protein kinase
MGGEPMLGQSLGSYRLVEIIAEGRSGIVYRAEDALLRRAVAVKVSAEGLFADRELARRYVHACSLAELRDTKQFVRIIGAALAEGDRPYVAMEIADGLTLDRLLLEQGALSEERVTRLAAQIAAAVATLHRRGRPHGGLEPRKIVVSGQGDQEQARLLEAELALILDRPLVAAAFQPPERAMSGPSPLGDVFAIGALIRAMLAGTLPGSEAPPYSPLAQLAEELAAPDPARRPASAMAVLGALERAGLIAEPAGTKRSKRGESQRGSRRPESARPAPPEAEAAPTAKLRAPSVAVQPRRWGWVFAPLVLVVAVAAFAGLGGGDQEQARIDAGPPPGPRDSGVVPDLPPPPPPPPDGGLHEDAAPIDAGRGRPDARGFADAAVRRRKDAAVEPLAPEPAGWPAPLEQLFAELDADLGRKLEEKGRTFDDLVKLEPNRTRTWGRWYKKVELPTDAALRGLHQELLLAIDRLVPEESGVAPLE